VGMEVDLQKIPNSCSRHEFLLFSETHSRFIIGTKNTNSVKKLLRRKGCIFSEIGKVDRTEILNLHYSGEDIINLSVNDLSRSYNTMKQLMD
jgi:phosphoribosylformylglycinamidine (FGAM) synthase-like enzyme